MRHSGLGGCSLLIDRRPSPAADKVICLDATQVVATLNDVSVHPTAASLDLGNNTLTLAGIVPGDDLVLNVSTTDTPNGIAFEGSGSCTPSINPEANHVANIFVNVRGTIINGIADIIVRTQQTIEQNRALAASDPQTAQMINMLLQFGGMQSISDLKTLWANTTEFELSLNLTR